MKRILLPLAIFAIWLSIIGLGASAKRGSQLFNVTNLTLVAIHLGLVAFLSVLVLIDRWHVRHGAQMRLTLLGRIRAWITDDRTLD